uniref:BLOC-1-related complex subunit 7 n=1 Tax=Steinernema glaseri TaxID=37863 RepID=A0A1I7Y341_9BILA
MFQLHRKRFSVRRNTSKRWRAAHSKEPGATEKDWDPTLVIKATNMTEEMQRQALEVSHAALTANNVENKVASQIKAQFDEMHGEL